MSLSFLAKKSWNPTNRRNVDDVKQREEKARAEAQKVRELRKEYAEEAEREAMEELQVKAGLKKRSVKGANKLSWMYDDGGVGDKNDERDDEGGGDQGGGGGGGDDRYLTGEKSLEDGPSKLQRKEEKKRRKEAKKRKREAVSAIDPLAALSSSSSKKKKKKKKKKSKSTADEPEKQQRFTKQVGYGLDQSTITEKSRRKVRMDAAPEL